MINNRKGNMERARKVALAKGVCVQVVQGFRIVSQLINFRLPSLNLDLISKNEFFPNHVQAQALPVQLHIGSGHQREIRL